MIREGTGELNHMHRKLMLGFVLTLLLVILLSLYWLGESQRMAVAAEQHQTIWAANCARCHGDNGEGGFGPALNNEMYLYDHSDAELGLKITEGKPPRMPVFEKRLTELEVKRLMRFIRRWQH